MMKDFYDEKVEDWGEYTYVRNTRTGLEYVRYENGIFVPYGYDYDLFYFSPDTTMTTWREIDNNELVEIENPTVKVMDRMTVYKATTYYSLTGLIALGGSKLGCVHVISNDLTTPFEVTADGYLTPMGYPKYFGHDVKGETYSALLGIHYNKMKIIPFDRAPLVSVTCPDSFDDAE